MPNRRHEPDPDGGRWDHGQARTEADSARPNPGIRTDKLFERSRTMQWSQRNSMLMLTMVSLLAIGANFAAHSGIGSTTGVPAPVTQIVQQMPPVSPEEARQALTAAKGLSTAFRVVSEKLLPCVVAIETSPNTMMVNGTQRGPRPEMSPGERNPFEGTPFGDFFKDNPEGQGFSFRMPPMQPRPQRGLGSGVIFDASGLILTNHHVVAGGGDVTVRLADGREFKAAQVWSDPQTDIAVVKIDGASDLAAARLGDSDLVAVGDWVLALGQPFGLESTVTSGIISAKGRGIGITPRENFLQTDAAINPGNSGGPLVNLDGEVIGVNTAISSRSGGNEGIGFAVPINLAKWAADQLAHGGTVHRAYLGVGIQPVTAMLADQFQVKPKHGVVVTDVFPDTPAAKAGLQSGDVIVEYAGLAVSTPQELQVAVERSEIGRAHTLSIVRDGKSMTLNFTPEEQPSHFGQMAASSADAAPRREFQSRQTRTANWRTQRGRGPASGPEGRPRRVDHRGGGGQPGRSGGPGKRHGDHANQSPAGRKHERCRQRDGEELRRRRPVAAGPQRGRVAICRGQAVARGPDPAKSPSM